MRRRSYQLAPHSSSQGAATALLGAERGHFRLPSPAAHALPATAETQKAPGKPFMRLETSAGPLVLGFGSMEDRDEAVELLVAAKPAAAGQQGAAPGGGKAAAAGGPAVELRKQLFDSDP